VARQGQILATAMRLFGERGFGGTALREIAAECGIAHTTLLHYFPTKQTLLMAVLAERDQRARSESEHLDDLTEILDFTRRIATTQGNDPAMIELTTKMMAEATDPAHPAHDFYRERSAQLAENLARLLENARVRGFLREGVEPRRGAAILRPSRRRAAPVASGPHLDRRTRAAGLVPAFPLHGRRRLARPRSRAREASSDRCGPQSPAAAPWRYAAPGRVRRPGDT
jgi:AcrR family transcriptional regulator